MIAWLKGVLVHHQPPLLVLDVQGVGYEMQAPMSTFYELPEDNQPVTLHVHMVVREDTQELFGFIGQRERDLFRHLIRVSGIGPRTALALLSSLSVADLGRCIRDNDVDLLTRTPGIGKKTAERLLVDMRDRIAEVCDDSSMAESSARAADPATQLIREAELALVGLGYKPAQAAAAINAVYEDGLIAEELIRRALRGLAAF